jgi:hypothetical protein
MYLRLPSCASLACAVLSDSGNFLTSVAWSAQPQIPQTEPKMLTEHSDANSQCIARLRFRCTAHNANQIAEWPG